MNSNYLTDKLVVLGQIVKEIENQLSCRFNEVTYTVRLKQLENETGVPPRISTKIVRDFLEQKNKKPDHRPASKCGAKYIISVKREEIEEWKRDIEEMTEDFPDSYD